MSNATYPTPKVSFSLSMAHRHGIRLDALGFRIPDWIDQDLCASGLLSIDEVGAENAVYWPATNVKQAMDTMSEYGDEIFDFLDGQGSPALEWISDPRDQQNWKQWACVILSAAVTQWARNVVGILMDLQESGYLIDDPKGYLIDTLILPAEYYEERASRGGETIRDRVPYEGAVRYVTDGKEWGVQYWTGVIDWLAGPIPGPYEIRG